MERETTVKEEKNLLHNLKTEMAEVRNQLFKLHQLIQDIEEIVKRPIEEESANEN